VYNYVNSNTFSTLRRGSPVSHCELCIKCIVVGLQLEAHLQLHCTNKQYHCHHCLAGFSDKASLDRHCTTVHSQVWRFPSYFSLLWIWTSYHILN